MSLKSTKKFIQPCLNQGKILAYIFLKRTNRLNARPPITRQPMNFIVKATKPTTITLNIICSKTAKKCKKGCNTRKRKTYLYCTTDPFQFFVKTMSCIFQWSAIERIAQSCNSLLIVIHELVLN